MIDEWSSSGSNIPRQIAHPPDDVPPPTDEMAFLQMRGLDVSFDLIPPNHGQPGLLAQMIALNRIFRDINQMNQRAVHDGAFSFDVNIMEELSERLRTWELNLPPYMTDSAANLAYYAAQGLGRIYVRYSNPKAIPCADRWIGRNISWLLPLRTAAVLPIFAQRKWR